ncbi:hypothetical protein OG898_26780 [Streptomyces sp. NBC_00193]|uniref:hypothetical protein n=1 Tax=unclassified Streptomyces TaxID=2593676 RepID=UPI00224F47BE|nr:MULTISPECIES: hypothetical protein [unclassified Streptomyces]MCX5126419.1 hypothetical protein [Streptomyces sp. NBC_00347]MCX5300052.1 hypothetical protein [Streptomyces sp. NBC_00193]
MSLHTSRRTAARTAVRTIAVTTLLAGAVLAPAAVASADSTSTPSKCVVVKEAWIGAGTDAVMTIAPSGPTVSFKDAGDGKVLPERLDRTHPKLPASAGFLAEILDPNGPAPKLRTNMEGGGHEPSVKDFPKLPKGCTFDYSTGTGTGKGAGKGQTKDVPKGGVAAGAEYEQGSGPSPIAVGGAAAAVTAAGLGFAVMRRRAASAGR